MSGVHIREVDADGDEQRLDRWFRRVFPHVPQGRIEKMCRKGEIRVEGGRVKTSTRLVEGQKVRIPPLPTPDEAAKKRAERTHVSDADARMIQDCVIYKDDDIIVLNKPAGLAVQGGSNQTRHIDGMAEALRFGLEAKPKLVHRLDKDTSGVLLLARNGQAAKGLTMAFRNKFTQKIYWALTAGHPEKQVGTIRFGLVKQAGHGPHGAGEKMICIPPRDIDETMGAKRATTDFVVIETVGKRATWLGLAPITGRTHQLRAHLAEIGCPIAGDGKYGGSGQVNEGEGWGAQMGGVISKKMQLHARSIKLKHPRSGKEMFFEAPLPDHMQRTWDFFGWNLKWAPKDPFEIHA
ncbi:MAG: RluA family pseudouridine synthase [Paracoccaceae bacterium]